MTKAAIDATRGNNPNDVSWALDLSTSVHSEAPQ